MVVIAGEEEEEEEEEEGMRGAVPSPYMVAARGQHPATPSPVTERTVWATEMGSSVVVIKARTAAVVAADFQ